LINPVMGLLNLALCLVNPVLGLLNLALCLLNLALCLINLALCLVNPVLGLIEMALCPFDLAIHPFNGAPYLGHQAFQVGDTLFYCGLEHGISPAPARI